MRPLKAVLILILLLFSGSPLAAQACMELRRDEIRALTAKDAPGSPSSCPVVCKGCGCKGGPGYRDDRGKCVGYRELISRCGEAPHARCTRECIPVAAGCSLPDIEGAKERAAIERATNEAAKARGKAP